MSDAEVHRFGRAFVRLLRVAARATSNTGAVGSRSWHI